LNTYLSPIFQAELVDSTLVCTYAINKHLFQIVPFLIPVRRPLLEDVFNPRGMLAHAAGIYFRFRFSITWNSDNQFGPVDKQPIPQLKANCLPKFFFMTILLENAFHKK
jgi:hypothetical protein